MYKKIKVVCFGGGTGLPALLSNLKDNPWLDITAIVNVTDTGGSSGELKDRFGILPPGDVLKCVLALSRQEGARELLLKRICDSEYTGHTGGNILLLGLEKVYGNFMAAVNVLGQLLSIEGKVIPVALTHSTLCAAYVDGSVYRGETSVDMGIREGKKIKKLFLDPELPASSEALDAIRGADVFCVGPGSFYTSVLPNFLPDGVSDALSSSKAKIIYIANLLTEGKGMQGMKLENIVCTMESYLGRKIDYVVANNHLPSDHKLFRQYGLENKYPIRPTELLIEELSLDERFVLADLWVDKTIARHDSTRLAHVVFDLINRYCS